jgi:ubiquinone/menaquinone biosynthesis C-methylase UbiE
MNEQHRVFCAGEDWRRMVQETILPEALRGVELGDDVIEVGPGPGFTTDVLRTRTVHLTAVEIDSLLASTLAERLAGGKVDNVDVVLGDATALDFDADRFSGAASFHMLHHVAPAAQQDRVFAELARVLVTGGMLVAADAGFNEGTVPFHEGDTYNPIEPEDLPSRLAAAGFEGVEVRTYDLGWVCTAVAASA